MFSKLKKRPWVNNFILASGNEHKAEEFNELFDSKILEVEKAPEKVEVIEDGKTFSENALKKCLGYYQKFKQPVLADDSGLVVSALPDELGIYSARFGGDGLDDKGRAELLLEKMKGVEDRSAYFVCVLCFYINEDEYYFFEGRVHGSIGHEYRGDHGFGYDPVFIPDGVDEKSTLAELPEWKNKNSHRSKASKHAQTFFRERDCQKA